MVYGQVLGEERVLVVPEGEGGKPIIESVRPEAPDGYEAVDGYVDAGTEIRQVWSLVPKQGTEADAAVALAKMQAAELSDGDAVKVPALYDEWSGESIEYKQGQRLRFQGLLVKVLQGHTSQPDWAPNAAPSLFAVILPGQDGSGVEVGIWQRPSADNGYGYGDKTIHNGHLWQSDYDPDGTLGGNVWEPGTVGSHWVDLGEWDGAE